MYTARRKIHKEKDVEPTEFEDSVAQDVILVATQRILRPPKKGPAIVRPHGCTLTIIHDAILEVVVYPAEIVGKHVRSRIDGSKIIKVEAKHNSENRRSTKRPRLNCTLGRKKQIHAYYDMQKKEGPAFNIAKAFIKCHKTPGTEDQYPNETKEYCEQFDEVARDMPICTQSSFSVISTITDKVSGRHHGGYERGLGRAFSRKLHPAAEKSPIISMYSSKDKQIAALSNRVKELKSKEVQRQQLASTSFTQSFSSASGTAIDIGAFMTYMTQFASQMNHFATQIGVPLPPGVPNAEPRHNGSGSNGHGGDEDNTSFSMHAD